MKSQIMQGIPFLFFLILLDLNNAEKSPCGITNLAKVKPCRGQHLEHVPHQLKIDDGRNCFKTIDLGENKFSSISDSEFSQISCINSVEGLLFDHNVISNISYMAFNALRSVRHLDVSYNNLTHVGNEFRSITTLEKLILDDNPIKFIGKNSIRYHKNLKYLSMKNALIRRLPKEFLKGSKLETLDLSGNCIDNWDEVYVPSTLKVIAPKKCSIPTTEISTRTTPSADTKDALTESTGISRSTSGSHVDSKKSWGQDEKSEEAVRTNITYIILVLLLLGISIVALLKKTNIAAKCFKRQSDNSETTNCQSNAPLMPSTDTPL